MSLARETASMVVMDLQMPGMNGPQSIAEVRGVLPDTPHRRRFRPHRARRDPHHDAIRC